MIFIIIIIEIRFKMIFVFRINNTNAKIWKKMLLKINIYKNNNNLNKKKISIKNLRNIITIKTNIIYLQINNCINNNNNNSK